MHNKLYNTYVLIDENTPGEASVSAPESISREYDELPLIKLEDLPPDQVIDPLHEAVCEFAAEIAEDDYDLSPDCSEEIKAAADKV